MRVLSPSILAVLIVATLSSPVSGDYLYTFTSMTFTAPLQNNIGYSLTGVYSPDDRISGTFLVPQENPVVGCYGHGCQTTPPFAVQLAVLSYNFTDGHQTLTEMNSSAIFAVLGAGPEDNLANPFFQGNLTIVGLTGEMYYHPTGPPLGSGDGSLRASLSDGSAARFMSYNSFPPTWTVQRVPEPPTWLLALAGIVAVVIGARLRREDCP